MLREWTRSTTQASGTISTETAAHWTYFVVRLSGLAQAEVADPFGRRAQAAERIEMQQDLAVSDAIQPVGVIFNQAIGTGGGEQFCQGEAILLHDVARGGHAAARGEGQQPFDAGWS